MKKFIAILLFNVLLTAVAGAKEEIAWDNTAKRSWLPEFEKVEITSSKDGAQQKAYIYKSKSCEPMPLIVSLHTWSGYYNQTDPLTKEILARDWNYIHPDFRGANRRPEAMGSPLTLADIEDAIQYALKNMNVDKNEVHVIGVSGGGFATLAAFMNLDYPVKSFSAWASISDIEDWYWEALCAARTGHDELVFVREFVDTEDGDDVLKLVVFLKELLDCLRGVVVVFTDDIGVEDTRC